MPLALDQVLHNRYRIVKLIGQGGFGAVYRAWDTAIHQPCAVKENLDTSPEAQRQFQREASILAGLRHPNLPRVTDHFFISDQGQYLVMDFVEGEDLQAMLDQHGSLPESQVLTWIGQVCDALVYLHSQPSPIIHRDIKPANIKICPGAQVMLVDFGIAKIYDPHLSTTVGAKAVTPGYSPPEQYGGGATDARSDIYALGATLYHLLTGQAPPESVQRMVGNVTLAAPRQLNSRISPITERAILKAMDVTTSRRFQHVVELHTALVQQAREVRPQLPISGWLWPISQRLKLLGGAGLGIILLVIGVLSISGVLGSRRSGDTPTATTKMPIMAPEGLVLTEMSAETPHLTDIPTSTFSPTSLPANTSAPSTPMPLRLSRIIVASAAQLEPVRTLVGHTRGVRSVAFAPSGRILASGSEDSTVRVWRVTDGARLLLLEGHTSSVSSVAFTPDGTRLASGSEDSTVRVWRADDGARLHRLVGHTGPVWSVAFAPDGMTLASGSEDSTVRVWRADDGVRLRLLEGHTEPVRSVAFAPDGTMLASGSEDGTVRVWRTADGLRLHLLEGHAGPVWSVAFAPDGMTLASGSEDGSVRIWRVADGVRLYLLEADKTPVQSVAFTPDGTILASGSADGKMRLWLVSDGTLLHSLQGNTDKVNSVAFAPDGILLASGSTDGTVWLWGVR
jgi:WD40 repeat protein